MNVEPLSSKCIKLISPRVARDTERCVVAYSLPIEFRSKPIHVSMIVAFQSIIFSNDLSWSAKHLIFYWIKIRWKGRPFHYGQVVLCKPVTVCGLALSCCKTYSRSFVTIFDNSEPSPRLAQYFIAYIFPLTGASWVKIQIAFSTYTATAVENFGTVCFENVHILHLRFLFLFLTLQKPGNMSLA